MLRLITVTVWLAALAVAQGPLRYETRRIEKNSPGCVVSFEYPEIISAASPEVRDRINAGILGVLLRRTDLASVRFRCPVTGCIRKNVSQLLRAQWE